MRGGDNPFAPTVDADGVAWVADNVGGPGPERIGRADEPASGALPFAERDAHVAPAALVRIGPGRFAVCGYLSGRVDELVIDGGTARLTGRVLARPCSVGMARLPDGRLATATPTAVHVSAAPVR